MSKRRLFSSDEIINALLRCGFELARKSKTGHQTLKRPRPDGRHDVTVVPMGKREIPKPTFDDILTAVVKGPQLRPPAATLNRLPLYILRDRLALV